MTTACTVALADPDNPETSFTVGDLVLGPGVSSAGSRSLLRSVAECEAAGLVLRRGETGASNALAGEAELLRVPLYWLRSEVRWTELHRQLLEAHSPTPIVADDALADLAQTIATLTGGLVTIEDMSARVLAYSRSSDEVDDLRRLSILGRSGPAEYLSLLREWGVYDRLATPEQVVEIAEHPEWGVRPRLAVGVFAGERQLGTIWVQQGQNDFPPHAQRALLGAARVTASQLVGQRRSGSASDAPDVLRKVLDGSIGHLGERDSNAPRPSERWMKRPCAVAVFEFIGGSADINEQQLQLDELARIITLHTAAYRRNALVTQLADRIYALLPELDEATGSSSAIPVLREAVATARSHLHRTVRSVIGPVVASVVVAGDSRRSADLGLSVAGDQPVTTFESVRPYLVAEAVTDMLANRPDLHDPQISDLVSTRPELAMTLLRYLDCGSDVARVAEDLKIHATTVRYRLRKATELTDHGLHSAEDRLAIHLQLRLAAQRMTVTE
jgi:DNA-binding PucR family transcriptional regulator